MSLLRGDATAAAVLLPGPPVLGQGRPVVPPGRRRRPPGRRGERGLRNHGRAVQIGQFRYIAFRAVR
jgi:hypothetical protein